MSLYVDYYKILDVEPTASEDEIKKAYHEIAKKLHPDAYPNIHFTEEETQKMIEDFTKVTEAYNILTDEMQRKIFDINYKIRQNQLKRKEELARQAEEERKRKEQEKAEQEFEKAFADIQKILNESKKEREQARQRELEIKRQQEIEKSRKQMEYENSFPRRLKIDYQNIRKKEKKNSFIKRHNRIDDNFYEEYWKKVDSIPKEILFYTAKGTVHVFGETLYQLNKLKLQKKDTLSKYAIRNRKIIATALIAGIVLSNPIGKTEKQESPLLTEEIVTVNPINYTEEPVTMTKYHRISLGDTLSQLAYDAHSSIDDLMRINKLDSSLIYIGDTLTIPYKIDKEDLDYYTKSIPVENRSLKEIAETFNTNIDTLLELNGESIQKINGQYFLLSNEVVVPQFITRNQLQNEKGASYN